MIIAITGGNGFIGKLLVKKYLDKGHQVRLLSRKSVSMNKNCTLFIGDLTSSSVDLTNFLENVDILFHCAGELTNESLMVDLHVYGTERLLNQAKGKVKRLVQLSSVGAYGRCRTGIVTEESLEYPTSIYETSKTISDNLVRDSGISYSILRPSIVFGRHMTNNSLNSMQKMILKGRFFYIGKSGTLLNYIHVDKVIDALIICGEKKNAIGEVFIISQSITIEKMTSSFLESQGLKRNFLRFPEWLVRLGVFISKVVPKFPLTDSRVDALTSRSIYSSNKIQNLLDFEFQTSLEEDFKLFIKEK